MTSTYFITGTDTGVGKTTFMTMLIRALGDRRVMAYKPVASGAIRTNNGLRNEDAERIQAVLNRKVAYEEINPWVFEAATAPHIAANTPLNAVSIARHCQRNTQQYDVVLVEGVGGWLVPLNDRETMVDVAQLLHAQIILVVGVRLGCLNHALLTAEHIARTKNVTLAGWVANHISPSMTYQKEYIDTLIKHLPAPLLAQVAYSTEFDTTIYKQKIDLSALKDLTIE